MKKVMFLLFLTAGGFVSGQDRLFTYTYQSNVLNGGQREIEVWNTYRTGKTDYFSRLDQRVEFETGLGTRLQTSFYLNFSSRTQAVDPLAGGGLETNNSLGFSNEWKLKLLDPVANPLGLALYGEYGIASDELELEGKLIADKRFGNLTLAVNLTGETEFEPEADGTEIEWESEALIDLNLALGWSFTSCFSLTMENLYRNVLGDGMVSHSALFTGPGLSFVMENFWVNCTIMPQVRSFSEGLNGKPDLQEFEKVQFRILFSYAF